MKTYFNQNYQTLDKAEEDFTMPTLREDLEKTRIALDIAYAGFDNAVDIDMIDCFIYEINALQKRYKHLSELATEEFSNNPETSYQKSSIRSLVSHVFS